MSLDLLSIILIIALAQGLFLLISMVLRNKGFSAATQFFCATLLVLLWFQMEFLSVRIPMTKWPDFFYLTRYGGWYIIGPLIWFYTRAYLLRSDFQWQRKDLFHFAPFILLAFIIPLLTNYLVLTWRSRGYGMLTVFDSFNDELSSLQVLYGFIFIGQFVHALVYSMLSLRFVKSYDEEMKQRFSNLDKKATSWLNTFHYLMIVFFCSIGIFMLGLFMFQEYRRDMDYFFVIPISVLIYVFSFRAFNSMGLVFLPSENGGNRKYKKSGLSDRDSELIMQKLKASMEEGKPYLDANLRLSDLAKELSLSSHHLSQVINEHMHSNFYDFINRYRIEEAKTLIEEKEHYTLLQIAMDAGFNNKNSFANAFKKHAMMTPTAFRKNLLHSV